jgi:hypothetical protein
MNISLLRTAGIVMLVASTQSPVAVIEDVKGNPAGVEVMDYVEVGRVINLGPQEAIVLGYLQSCWRETIIGGTVTVGPERSDVQGGMVERSTVACEAGKMPLTAPLANKSGTMVFRGVQGSPQLTLYGLSPIFEVRPGGTLVIARIDKPGEQHEVALRAEQLVRGIFLDLATVGITLTGGGVYRAKAGAQEIVFKIDHDAKPGQTPIVGRLLRLLPTS